MSKKGLTNGVSLKVANRSGFDKSFFNALTTGVGTITPIVKQLMIPNSSGLCRVKISAQLPPLATDAFLRCHLKLEAFFVPLRLCYGGFESWFCGREVFDTKNGVFTRAKLPSYGVPDFNHWDGQFDTFDAGYPDIWKEYFAAGSLLDYFGGYWSTQQSFAGPNHFNVAVTDDNEQSHDEPWVALNIFPWLCYSLIYDEFYRNKFVEKPLFSPPTARPDQDFGLEAQQLSAYNLPYIACGQIVRVLGSGDELFGDNYLNVSVNEITDALLNGSLSQLRQRNYGDDYFTAAMPTAQSGNPISVSVVNNAFTIGALRMGSSMQEFEEINGYASPDYVQTLSARYGASLSYGVAQKPIYLGSADFPMYTSGVEQTANSTTNDYSTSNPFNSVGARYGRGHAEGTEFVCNFNVDEPGYFMVMATLVPEAQYYQGISKDLTWFTDEGSITDLPIATFENIGNEEIGNWEVKSNVSGTFGFVQRYLYHKLGNRNQVHGKFRMDESLGSFVVQRDIDVLTGISSSFLKVDKSDLDNVAAVQAGISEYGVMIDSAIDLFVSEPLSESAIPSLVDPAKEHGHSVYVKTGGSKLA